MACYPRQNLTAGVSSFALIQLCDVCVAVCLNVLTENVTEDLMQHQFGEFDSTNAYQRPCSCGRLVKVTFVKHVVVIFKLLSNVATSVEELLWTMGGTEDTSLECVNNSCLKKKKKAW